MVEILKKRLKKKDLKTFRKNHKKKKIGLCHGSFDILHYGHILHLKESKKNVDILILSVTADKYIKKGPNNPFNNQELRARYLEELSFVDFVYIDENFTAKEVIKELQPNLYFKGKDYLAQDITGNLDLEINQLKKNKGRLFITETELLSSTKIINHLFFNDKKYQDFLNKIDFKVLKENINKIFKLLENKEINIIGEPITDNYTFCKVVGITSKDPAISTIQENNKNIPGGVLAMAKIASNFCKKINLYSYGEDQYIKKYFKNVSNIKFINLSKNSPIQTKTRYINSNRYEKLLQVSNFSKNIFSLKQRSFIQKKILKIKKNLIICDFGNSLFLGETLKCVNNLKINKYINVQSNSLNSGYNLFTKYKNMKYLSLDEKEWKLGLGSDEIDISKIKSLLGKNVHISITKGKNGSSLIDKKNNHFSSPVFVNKVIDTTGCGDAYFIITSLLLMFGFETKYIPFMGNIYAGMHSQFLGNSKIVDKMSYYKYLNSVLKK